MNENSIANKLSELFELHKSGALTKEEYDKLKEQIISAGGVDNVESETKQEPEITKSNDKSIQFLSEFAEDNVEPEKKQEQEAIKTLDKLIRVKKNHRIWIFSIIAVVFLVVLFLVFKTNIFSGKSRLAGQKEQTVKDVDGNTYKTVTIGTQLWMAENLKTTKYNDGTSIPFNPNEKAWEALNTPAYCWYDNNETVNKNTCGALYNWYAVNTNKLCPTGWHVPTNEEWTTLISYLGGEDVAGGKLKETGTIHWKSPNTGATNETGFNALPSGYLHHLGTFKGIGSYNFWWSASEYDATQAWNGNVSYNHSKVNKNNYMFQNGLSVRCLRDLGASKNNLSVNNTPIVKNITAVWDEVAATKIIMAELSKYPDWSKKAVNDISKWNHEIISFNKISLSQKDLMVVITLSENKSNDRYFSIFEFENRDGWKLGKKSIAFTQDNGFEKNLYNIAPNNYGLLIKGSEGVVGSSYDTKYLYAFINGELKLIFSIVQRWDNVNSSGKANLMFNLITKSDGYYDIELIDKIADSSNETRRTVIYKFNGSVYEKNDGNTAEVNSSDDNSEFIIDYDGNGYKTIKIGTQVWMAENLKTTKLNDGTEIKLVIDNDIWSDLTTPAYCWYNNDATANKNTYGALYNWFAVNTNKLCPTGWHVPTDAEWTTLTTYLGGESVAGVKLKESGETHWLSPEGANNESGFTALPGGSREYGTCHHIGDRGKWWSSTESSAASAYDRGMFSFSNTVSRDDLGYKRSGFSVRCLKDK